MADTFGGRVFDRIPSAYDPRNYPLASLLAVYKSAEDKILEAQLEDLNARVTALEHGQPAPAPVPVPPTPVPPVPAVTSRLWPHPAVTLDQQNTGRCVGHGWAAWFEVTSSPEIVPPTVDLNPVALKMYSDAQRITGQPQDDQSGTTVAAGAKAARQDYAHNISAYHVAASVAEAQQAILKIGPVVVGTDWYSNMMDPDNANVIHASGSVVGGHCLLWIGYDPAKKGAENTLLNSWGSSWGQNGEVQISDADLRKLFSTGAEFYCPTI